MQVPRNLQLTDSRPGVRPNICNKQFSHHCSSGKVPETNHCIFQKLFSRNMGLWELTLMYFFLCESSTLPTTPATSSEDIFLQMTWLTDSKSKVHLKLPSPFPCHDNRQSQGIQQFPGNLPSSRGRQPNPGQTYLQNWKCCPREFLKIVFGQLCQGFRKLLPESFTEVTSAPDRSKSERHSSFPCGVGLSAWKIWKLVGLMWLIGFESRMIWLTDWLAANFKV